MFSLDWEETQINVLLFVRDGRNTSLGNDAADVNECGVVIGFKQNVCALTTIYKLYVIKKYRCITSILTIRNLKNTIKKSKRVVWNQYPFN